MTCLMSLMPEITLNTSAVDYIETIGKHYVINPIIDGLFNIQIELN